MTEIHWLASAMSQPRVDGCTFRYDYKTEQVMMRFTKGRKTPDTPQSVPVTDQINAGKLQNYSLKPDAPLLSQGEECVSLELYPQGRGTEMSETKVTDDEIWVLEEASKKSGFVPHARSTAEFVVSLETRGWLRRSGKHPVWFITDSGRSALRQKEER